MNPCDFWSFRRVVFLLDSLRDENDVANVTEEKSQWRPQQSTKEAWAVEALTP
jgi:hypothetical protein